ncbi:cell shape determining protein MreB [Williamsoniiplasma luminosum]|uniref:Cell shape determining protein MreB n=1 Tax=Williamsoniiplasma luminosum TaxID=214888 RepID=A0A2K8NSR9_9MOLU|nr:rod shape-determining protein [Williamsoniiplasma luminosum]ATZ16895.1 cell shape determining protein MreB [Williamsoniiplasma luminosum]
MNKRIGIVFDETDIKVVSSEDGVLIKEKTVVLWNEKENKIVLYGEDVLNLENKIGTNLSIIHPLEDGEIKNLKIFQNLIHLLFGQIKDEFKDADVIISKTSDNELVLDEFSAITSIYQPKNIRFEDSSKLIAIGAGININDDYGKIILEVENHCAKISVFANGDTVASKQLPYGEKYINQKIKQHFKEKKGIILDDSVLDKIKYGIGSVLKLKDDLEIVVAGIDTLSKEKKKILVSSSSVRKIFLDLFNHYKNEITKLLETLPFYISTGIVKNGMSVVGSIGKISGVNYFFKDFFDWPVEISNSTEDAILFGLLKIK